MTKGPLFLQDKDKDKVKNNLIKKEELMAQRKNSLKLNEVQEVLLNEKDFLKRAFTKSLKMWR